jgi:hypothetical protein
VKKLLVLAVIAVAAWQGYARYQARRNAVAEGPSPSAARLAEPSAEKRTYTCDGRVYCSQMTSCAEATYFLRNCPGTKMDGNNDGVPCERQWCN